jgi:Protein of unknown function (DUF1549)/Protein of unknown function (DUF1553)/Planctomycete cytochrome C
MIPTCIPCSLIHLIGKELHGLIMVAMFFVVLSAAAHAQADAAQQAKLDFFEARIRPALIEHCYECHSAESKIVHGGLRLDSRNAMRRGGDSGAAVVIGKPEESLLLQAMQHASLEMPPDKKLAENLIADFESWIREGAVDPREDEKPPQLAPVDFEAARSHWAFQRIANPQPPLLQDSSWVTSPIDVFVLEQLQQAGVAPSPLADKYTLIRRATFDLIGLPPEPEEIAAFLQDDSPEAFARVVDRLLGSPHYGERWGRHWLDLVRFATTNGADENHELPNAWRYRDWVVKAINCDLPIDQFITQQIAGDLLPAPADEQQAGDLLTATGMLVIGPKMLAEQDKEKMLIDIVDEQVDTVGRTMLGLTIGCARCHDHKFDPISAKDYYALAGIFFSTQSMADRAFVSKWMERALPSQSILARRAEHQPKIDAAKAALAALKSPEQDEEIKQHKAALEQLEKEMPAFDYVMATQEGEIRDLPLHIRGNHLRPGPEAIRRGMPTLLTQLAAAAEIPPQVSGRRELADWLVSPDNPLTARVMVNRIWMWHFGKPLMNSPSNWGLQADKPSHPALLDWLANEFMHTGWSLKAMHRTMMLSATYQMQSANRIELHDRDPENRLLWRQNRRRLEAEPVRDAILFAGGGLDRSIGNGVAQVDSSRRAIYLKVDRAALYEMFSTFDYVETANHIERRPTTTVPNQALFLMNSRLVHDQARQLIGRLVTADPPLPLADSMEIVDALFLSLYGRRVLPQEFERVTEFLSQTESALAGIEDARERRLQSWATLCRTLMAANEFIYVD